MNRIDRLMGIITHLQAKKQGNIDTLEKKIDSAKNWAGLMVELKKLMGA